MAVAKLTVVLVTDVEDGGLVVVGSSRDAEERKAEINSLTPCWRSYATWWQPVNLDPPEVRDWFLWG